MKTRTLFPILCAALLAFVAIGCQKEENITPDTPDTPDTIPVGPTYTSADLIPGPAFNESLPEYYTAIRFVCGDSTVTSGTLLSTDSSQYPIYGNLDDDTWIVTTAADSMFTNPNCDSMFRGIYYPEDYEFFSNLTSIDFGPGFSTTKATTMQKMFQGCTEMPSVDLSCFNTANVTDMYCMFSDCLSFTSFDFTHLNTKNVIDMGFMLAFCENLTNVDLSAVRPDHLEYVYGMFDFCEKLTTIDLTPLSTPTMKMTFCLVQGCQALTSANLTNFNTDSVTDMAHMFQFCERLTDLDLSSFNTSNVTEIRDMFAYCKSLERLDLSHFDMTNVTEKTDMCYRLASISHDCTITCTAATQSALQSGTGLTNQYITWDIVEDKHSAAHQTATHQTATSQSSTSQSSTSVTTTLRSVKLSNGQIIQTPIYKRK